MIIVRTLQRLAAAASASVCLLDVVNGDSIAAAILAGLAVFNALESAL